MSLKPRLSVGLIVAVAALAAPSFASAAGVISATSTTVTITPSVPTGGDSIVHFAITNDATNLIFTSRDGVPVRTQPGSGCSQVTPELVVQCPYSAATTSIQGTLAGVTGSALANGSFIDASDMTAQIPLAINGGLTGSGNSGPIQVEGGPAADVLTGGDSRDVLYGGPGNDTIVGGAGGDHLIGDGGEDLLTGGPGGDYLGFEFDAPDGDPDNPNSTCGPGAEDPDDAMGLNLPGDEELMDEGVCARIAPHAAEYPGEITLSQTPQAGTTYSAATGLTHGPMIGTEPNAFDISWYVCDTPGMTGQVVNNVRSIRGDCQLIGRGSSIDIPADATEKYLGAVGNLGLLTNAGDLTQVFAFASYSIADAVLITAPSVPPVDPPAPPAPPAPQPPPGGGVLGVSTLRVSSTISCKSTSCSIAVGADSGGRYTIAQAGATASKKTSKRVTTSSTTLTSASGRIKVKLTSAAVKELKRKGSLKIRVKISYTPSGSSTAQTKTITLSYKLPKKGK